MLTGDEPEEGRRIKRSGTTTYCIRIGMITGTMVLHPQTRSLFIYFPGITSQEFNRKDTYYYDYIEASLLRNLVLNWIAERSVINFVNKT